MTPAREQAPDAHELLRQLDDCTLAIAADPGRAKLYSRKGKLLQALQRADEAEACFEVARGLRSEPGPALAPAVRDELSAARKRLVDGDAEGAERIFMGIAARHPACVDAWIGVMGARHARGFPVASTASEWRAAAPGHAGTIAIVTAREFSRRGLLLDPAASFALVRRAEALAAVERPEDLATTGADASLLLAPGGLPVRHEPIISVADDGSDWFAVETESSESFVAVLHHAVLAGRGLVITQRHEVIAESLAANPLKHGVAIHDGRVRFRPGRYVPDPDTPVRIWDSDAFLMAGPTDQAFGDWIWKFPPRLTLAREAGVDAPLVVSTQLPSRYIDMLDLLGYDRSRLIFHKPGTVALFRRLFVPSWPTNDRLRPMRRWGAVYEALGQRGMALWRADAGEHAPRPLLYLARTRVAQRPLVNEVEVIELFRSRGFRILHPQDLSWRDILSIFACPSVVAGPYGSALRNLALCHQKPIALVLTGPSDEEFMRGSALWLAELGARFAYVRGVPVPGEEETDPRVAPWTIDVSRVERALDRVLAAALS